MRTHLAPCHAAAMAQLDLLLSYVHRAHCEKALVAARQEEVSQAAHDSIYVKCDCRLTSQAGYLRLVCASGCCVTG